MKRTTKRATAVAFGAIAALTLAACSSDTGDGTDTGSAGGDGGGGDISIGIAIPAGNHTFFTSWMNGAQEKADELGVEITFSDAKDDAQTMNDQVNTMIVSGIDGLAVVSVDPTANTSTAQAATDAGIPMITSNRSLELEYGGVGGANPIVHTGFNDIQIGQLQGELLIEACADLDPCRVALEVGTLGTTPQVQRSQGLKDTIADHANIQIVIEETNNFDPVKATEVTQTILQEDPDLDFILTQTDPEAVAASTVLAEQGLEGEIGIIGIGGSTDGVNAVADGRLFGTVRVSAHEDGAASVATLVALVKGEGDSLEVDTSGDRPTVVVPAKMVTAENASDPDMAGDW